PGYGGGTPSQGAQAPAYGGQAPEYGGQASAYGGQASAYGGQAPEHGPGAQAGPGGYGAAQPPAYGTPDPYQSHQQHQQPAQQPYPAQPAGPLPDAYPAAGAALPPPADAATQYIAPVPAGPGGAGAPAHEGATQYLPPVQAAPADGATQYIPPVASGALPPESQGEETRYLGQVPRQTAPAPSDAEATQYIPPYAAQGQAQGADRQPPAEFDNLFRGGPAADDGPAGSTQQLPLVQQPDAYPGPEQSSYRPAQPSYDAEPDGGGRRGGRSRVPLIAAVGVGLIVVGVGAGALLSAGGGKDQGGDDKGQTVAATSPATQGSSSPAVDPARQQAVELDKLLADSGSSRASVIQAVADVKQCDKLDQAAGTLRGAAAQRNQLVARLGKLTTDKLHAQGQLRDALTKAWQASAAADNHYAAWAGQAKGHKGCHKGHARTTGETQAGNRESGTASAQKTKAAAMWNAIAQKYGLTQRQPTQL
ncbi:hypothetical protein, partial [Streptomyces sp. SID161]|uniref:hypothetical protein n=1 Tax=Streptomyces sp. SID161 TaxID=2690251 RepID=UPI00136A8FA4